MAEYKDVEIMQNIPKVLEADTETRQYLANSKYGFSSLVNLNTGQLPLCLYGINRFANDFKRYSAADQFITHTYRMVFAAMGVNEMDTDVQLLEMAVAAALAFDKNYELLGAGANDARLITGDFRDFQSDNGDIYATLSCILEIDFFRNPITGV